MAEDIFSWINSKNQLPKPRPMSPYDVGVGMANNEFDVDMEPYLDWVARYGYDPDVAKVAYRNNEAAGFYIPMRSKDIEGDMEYFQKIYGGVIKEKSVVPGNVYVADHRIGDGSVYSHEYRHRGLEMIGNHIDTLSSDGKNTLAKTIKNRGIRRYSEKSIRKAIDTISNDNRKSVGESWVSYMDTKGKAKELSDKQLKDNPGRYKQSYKNRTLIEPIVASHIAQILDDERNSKEK